MPRFSFSFFKHNHLIGFKVLQSRSVFDVAFQTVERQTCGIHERCSSLHSVCAVRDQFDKGFLLHFATQDAVRHRVHRHAGWLPRENAVDGARGQVLRQIQQADEVEQCGQRDGGENPGKSFFISGSLPATRWRQPWRSSCPSESVVAEK